MSEELYGTIQVREMKFTPPDLIALVLENIRNRDSLPYGFDYQRPIIIWDESTLILRFVQKEVTSESSARDIRFKSFAELTAKK